MCCEECSRYEICEDNNRLKDDCCPKCSFYYDCVGVDNNKSNFKHPFRKKDYDDDF